MDHVQRVFQRAVVRRNRETRATRGPEPRLAVDLDEGDPSGRTASVPHLAEVGPAALGVELGADVGSELLWGQA